MALRIISITEEYIDGFRSAVDAVARERKYLGFVEAPPMEQTLAFVGDLLANGGIQLLAVTDTNSVAGWCDVARVPWDGLRHIGRMGMVYCLSIAAARGGDYRSGVQGGY